MQLYTLSTIYVLTVDKIVLLYVRKTVHICVHNLSRWKMIRTATVTELRSGLASYLQDLEEGPILVLSHSRPAAVLLEPELFDAIMEKCELLEDILDGRRALNEYMKKPGVAVDAEEAFERLGY